MLRRTIAGLAVVGVALSVTANAVAATVAIPNACHWSVPGEWNNETLTFTGLASSGLAGAGTPVSLSGVSARIVFPREVIDVGLAVGLLKPGENEIPIRAWAAVKGTNTIPATQVVETSAIARTTIVIDAEGAIVSATPIDVQAPFPDTQWTTAADAPTSFSQADAGTLPPLPVGRNGGSPTPKGSVFIEATLGPSALQLDCQPGTRSADATGPVPAPGPAFAAVAAPDGTTAPPPAAPKPKPALTLLSTKLAIKDAMIAVKLRCQAAPCAGVLRMASASKVTQGKRKRTLTVTRALRYSLPAGTSRTVRLKLTAGARALLRERGLAVRLTAEPVDGNAPSRRYTLRRLVGR